MHLARRGLARFLLSFGLVFWSAIAIAETKETIRLTNGEWQPYLSQHLPHHGAASHIVTEAFALVGMKVEYGFFAWPRSMKLAKEGNWDGTAVWTDSEERRTDFFLTDPIIPSKWVFFHLNDLEFDWKTFEDLRGVRIGGTVEYSYGQDFEEAEQAGTIQTARARSDEVALRNLLKGRIDLFPGELLVTYEQIRDSFSKDEAARFTHHPKSIHDQPLHLLLTRKDPANERIRNLFNEGLKQLRESGRYDQILVDAMAGNYAKPK